jgi:hypothetical protein
MRAQSIAVFLIALVAGCAIPIIGAHASGGASASRDSDRPRAQRAAPRERPAAVARKQPRKQPQASPVAAKSREAQARAVHREPPAPPEPKAAAPRYALSTGRPAARGSAPGTCYAKLDHAGVRYERVDRDEARGVQYPTRLHGPVGGVEIVQHDRRAPGHQAILDCRLALAVLTWAPSLRRAGVKRIEHYSMYRPGARVGGNGKKSGHSTGMALDAARFHLDGGQVVDVLSDWEDRDRGDAPCPRRDDEAWQSRLLRGLVCEAVDRNLFQVVITPHHDRAHENHVHLELRPEVDWTYVR